MLTTILLLLSPRLTGLPAHEWLGLSLGIIVMIHLLLSWAWIASTTAGLVRRATWRTRVNFALNVILFILLVLVITSGIAISVVAVPALGVATIDDRAWRSLHNLTLNWLVLLTGFHVVMNWRPLVAGVRRAFAFRHD